MRASRLRRRGAAMARWARWLAAGAVATASAPCVGEAAPDDARASAMAQVQALNADLLSHDSATETLQRWCAARDLADPATIVAHRVHGVDKPASPGVRRALHA